MPLYPIIDLSLNVECPAVSHRQPVLSAAGRLSALVLKQASGPCSKLFPKGSISLMDPNLMLTWRKVEEHRRKRIENNEEGKETIKKLLQKHRWQMKEIVMYPLSSPMNYCVKPSLKP